MIERIWGLPSLYIMYIGRDIRPFFTIATLEGVQSETRLTYIPSLH